MAVENLPHWTLPPNWSSPVTERLEWLSAVLTSPTGAEQRFSLRTTPRRTFEANFMVDYDRRSWFDLATGAVGASPWYLPVWHDVSILDAEVTSGATHLPVNFAADREFVSGGFAMLVTDLHTSAVVEIAEAVTPSGVRLVTPLAATWPAGTRVYPAVRARFDQQPEMARRGGAALEGVVRFMVDQPNTWLPVGQPPVYANYPVLTVNPNESDELTHAYARMLVEMDNSVGKKRVFDTADIGFTVQMQSWMAVGRAEKTALRSFFYWLRGRVTPIWLPTFANDFWLVADASAASTNLTVRKNGFTGFGGPRTGREHIEILLRDGTRVYRRITGSSISGNTESLTLNSAVGVDLTPANVRRISFISLSRLDQDGVDITHHSSAEGVMTVSATFRSTPENRIGTDYAPHPFLNTTMTDTPCGVCTPGLDVEAAPTVFYRYEGTTANLDETNLFAGAGGAYGLGGMWGTLNETWMAFGTSGATVYGPIQRFIPPAQAGLRIYGATLPDGDVMVVWNTRNSVPGGFAAAIWSNVHNPDGTEAGPADNLILGSDTATSGNAGLHGVAATSADDANPGFFTFYTELVAGDRYAYIDKRRADAQTVAIASVEVTSVFDYWEMLPRALCRSGEVLAAAYLREYGSGKQARLVLKFYNTSDLSLVAGPVEVGDVSFDSGDWDEFVSLKPAPGGRFMVVWSDHPNGQNNYSGATLRVRFFNSSGAATGASAVLHTFTLVNSGPFDPSRKPNGADITLSGNYILVGESRLDSDYYLYPYATLFELNGGAWTQVAERELAPQNGWTSGWLTGDVCTFTDGTIGVAHEREAEDLSLVSEITVARIVITECV